jgi:hypothetical protein
MAHEFPEEHWDELRGRMERGGASAVGAFIDTFADPEQRRTLWAFAQKAFTGRDWQGKSFDGLIDIVGAGMDESLVQLAETTDPALQNKTKEHANILAFNLSSELAECWPGDERPRERHHFETGLALAEDCIRWRRQLGKPPERRALAYWAAGMHHLSLGNRREARGYFDIAAALAAEQVEGTEKAGVKPGGDFAAILYEGYAGLAVWALGEQAGRGRYERSLRAFEGTVAQFEGGPKDDAQFGIDQLRVVERKFAPVTTAA